MRTCICAGLHACVHDQARAPVALLHQVSPLARRTVFFSDLIQRHVEMLAKLALRQHGHSTGVVAIISCLACCLQDVVL